MQFRRQNRVTPKLAATVLAVIVLVGVGVVVGYSKFRSRPATPPDKPRDVNSVDYSPATDEEKKTADDQKDQIVKDAQQNTGNNSQPGQKKSVTPVIVNPPDGISVPSGEIQISMYVSGIFEEGGSCKVSFTRDQDTVEASSKGFQNSNYTSCAPMTTTLSKGTWKMVALYTSATATGQVNRTVEVK